MPFDLGFLSSAARGGGSPAPSHGAGPGALGDLGRLKVSQGYLAEQQKTNAYAREQDFNAKVEKEQGRRREAIDAWLGAVRSGNRADVWVLGKRLNAMGINVQMPTSFSATGVPGEGEAGTSPDVPAAVAPATPPATPMTPEQQKTGAAVDKLGADTVGALGGTFEPPGSDFDAPGAVDRFLDADTGESQGRLGPPGTTTSGTPVMNPFGPAGPSMTKAPTMTWRVTDPVTGTNIEISPEEILQDQEKELDQTFGPLTQMPGLDPIAQRAYAIGHEYAKGQIGFLPPKEAAAAGMAAADRYMTHMYQQGMVTAAQMKAMKKAGGGAGVGGGTDGFAGANKPGTKGAVNASKELTDDLKAAASDTFNQENYKKNVEAQRLGGDAQSKLDTNMGVSERGALGAYIKSITGAAATDAERSWYTGAAGFWSSFENKVKYVTDGGKLSPQLVKELRAMLAKAQGIMAARERAIKEQAYKRQQAIIKNRARAYGINDPETLKGFEDEARGNVGLSGEKKKAPNSKAKAKATADEQARRLLE